MARRQDPIRRSNLISPFGVGAMHVSPHGVSVITAGLDHWFKDEASAQDPGSFDIMEFTIEEWRLKRLLGVSGFRLPPDYRAPWEFGGDVANVNLKVPGLRFPQWHFCSNKGCRKLVWKTLSASERRPRCPHCDKKGQLRQVPFVVACEEGHLSDFPFAKWVHRSLDTPGHQGHDLTLSSSGGGSLSSQRVTCSCGETRTLAGITQASNTPGRGTRTTLSSTLSNGSEYLCKGWMPWHGRHEGFGNCEAQVRGALRASTNTYFAEVRSSIYLPRSTEGVPADLVRLLEAPRFGVFITAHTDAGLEVDPAILRTMDTLALRPFTNEQISEAVGIIAGEADPDQPGHEDVPGDSWETAFRRAEFAALQIQQDETELKVSSSPVENYGDWMSSHFSSVHVIEKLRETRAHVGFQRINVGGDHDTEALKAMLRRDPATPPNDWLPAYVVFGEGILLKLDEDKLAAWESSESVQSRIGDFQTRYTGRPPVGLDIDQPIPPRFLLLHTLAHIVMNQITFDAGYSTASIRERLYASAAAAAPMGGVLIYTAAGDAEGTMGGLVRIGRPGILERSLSRAIDKARWCAADPVCMEHADHGGQGPDGCNLAACHGCALMPETACEQFNKFLDRALLIGSPEFPDLGFFN